MVALASRLMVEPRHELPWPSQQLRDGADRKPLVLHQDPNALGPRLVHGVVHVVELLHQLDVDLGRIRGLRGNRHAATQVADPHADRRSEPLEERGEVPPDRLDALQLSDQSFVGHEPSRTHWTVVRCLAPHRKANRRVRTGGDGTVADRRGTGERQE
jgi:hypothetical protein